MRSTAGVKNYSELFITSVIRRFSVTFLAIALLLSAAVQEFLHHDVALNGAGRLSFASHTCQGKELHVPLDDVHGCAMCAQSLQRHSVAPRPGYLPIPDVICTTIVLARGNSASSSEVSSTVTRGPPLA